MTGGKGDTGDKGGQRSVVESGECGGGSGCRSGLLSGFWVSPVIGAVVCTTAGKQDALITRMTPCEHATVNGIDRSWTSSAVVVAPSHPLSLLF